VLRHLVYRKRADRATMAATEAAHGAGSVHPAGGAHATGNPDGIPGGQPPR
jgi:hypothetical protein